MASNYGPPPKDGKGSSNLTKEIAWFNRLPEVKELFWGDILLKKVYDGKNMVVKSQSWFSGWGGTKYTGHAAIAVYASKGAGMATCLAESKSGQGPVLTHPVPADTRYIVYRCTVPGAAESAAIWALSVASGDYGKVEYSKGHCLHAGPHSSDFGENAQQRQLQIINGQLPDKAMMCSEFVTYAYQTEPPPYIKLDAKHTSPMRLECYLYESKFFKLIGRLGPTKQ